MNPKDDLARANTRKSAALPTRRQPGNQRPNRRTERDFVELYLDQLRHRAGWGSQPRP